MASLSRCLATAVALLLPGAASHAHRAFSAEFDADLPVRMSGMVTRVEWINPHAWVQVRVQGEDGARRDWMLEADAPNTLLFMGSSGTGAPRHGADPTAPLRDAESNLPEE